MTSHTSFNIWQLRQGGLTLISTIAVIFKIPYIGLEIDIEVMGRVAREGSKLPIFFLWFFNIKNMCYIFFLSM